MALVPIMFWDTVSLKVVLADGATGVQPMAMTNGASRHAWTETLAQYLEWGKRSGRKDGDGWSARHLRNTADHLAQWTTQGFEYIEDVTPARYSKYAEELRQMGYASKYRRGRESTLHALLNWCVAQKLIAENVIESCRKSSSNAQKQCRAFTFEEFARLHAVVKLRDPRRALLYRTGVLTGFRRSELRSLIGDDLVAKENLLHLKAENEKLRVERWFPLTPRLALALKESREQSGALYPLLKMQKTPIQQFNRDLEFAKIDKHAGGVLDFHGLRRTGSTWLGILGAPHSVRHAFTRHSDRTTNQRYDLASQGLLRTWIVKMEKTLQQYETGKIGDKVEDTGIEPVTFRLPVGSDLGAAFSPIIEAALAYLLASDAERERIRLLSKEVLNRKFGGGN